MAACKCPVCSGRRRWFTKPVTVGASGNTQLARDPDRVMVVISGQYDQANVPPMPSNVTVFAGLGVNNLTAITQELDTPLLLTVETYGQFVMGDLTVQNNSPTNNIVVFTVLLRAEDDSEGSMTQLVGK